MKMYEGFIGQVWTSMVFNSLIPTPIVNSNPAHRNISGFCPDNLSYRNLSSTLTL